jgi:hypothetical protein
MKAAAISTVIGFFEAAIVAAPSLGVSVLSNLSEITSDTRKHKSAFVWRTSTINTDATRNVDRSMVDDTITVRLTYKIAPKNQKTSRNAATDLADTIRNRLTSKADTDLISFRVLHLADDEEHHGEWVVIDSIYQTSRFETVGQG